MRLSNHSFNPTCSLSLGIAGPSQISQFPQFHLACPFSSHSRSPVTPLSRPSAFPPSRLHTFALLRERGPVPALRSYRTHKLDLHRISPFSLLPEPFPSRYKVCSSPSQVSHVHGHRVLLDRVLPCSTCALCTCSTPCSCRFSNPTVYSIPLAPLLAFMLRCHAQPPTFSG